MCLICSAIFIPRIIIYRRFGYDSGYCNGFPSTPLLSLNLVLKIILFRFLSNNSQWKNKVPKEKIL